MNGSPLKGLTTPARATRSPAVDGSSLKKKQSSLKGLVQGFAKLILSWQKDVDLIKELLQNISERQNFMGSIRKAAVKRLCIFERFPFVEQRLIAQLVGEVESFFNVVKQTLHGLGDVLAAMQMTAHDALQATLNESVQMFPSDAIFTVDHVLDIQQLNTHFALEYQRKQELIDALARQVPPSLNSGDAACSIELLSQVALITCLATFADDCEESLLDRFEGAWYLSLAHFCLFCFSILILLNTKPPTSSRPLPIAVAAYLSTNTPPAGLLLSP